jgi:hypothetical protein
MTFHSRFRRTRGSIAVVKAQRSSSTQPRCLTWAGHHTVVGVACLPSLGQQLVGSCALPGLIVSGCLCA